MCVVPGSGFGQKEGTWHFRYVCHLAKPSRALHLSTQSLLTVDKIWIDQFAMHLKNVYIIGVVFSDPIYHKFQSGCVCSMCVCVSVDSYGRAVRQVCS